MVPTSRDAAPVLAPGKGTDRQLLHHANAVFEALSQQRGLRAFPGLHVDLDYTNADVPCRVLRLSFEVNHFSKAFMVIAEVLSIDSGGAREVPHEEEEIVACTEKNEYDVETALSCMMDEDEDAVDAPFAEFHAVQARVYIDDWTGGTGDGDARAAAVQQATHTVMQLL